MKKDKKIILTFDHELFLGSDSGTVQTCFIEPVELLQEIFNDFKIQKAIFFLDTTYLSCLKRQAHIQSYLDDYNSIKSQIKFLLEKGHYVFPHIHPHWLDAEAKDGKWVLKNLEKYTLNNCSLEEREKIWKDSMSILKEFGVADFHSIDGFRAGGWSIQPFSDYKPYFIEHGIKYDFTVMPSTFSYTNAQKYDFTSIEPQAVYRFNDEVDCKVEDGEFYEFPISVRTSDGEKSLKEKIFQKILYKTGNRSIGKGQGVLPQVVKHESKKAPKDLEMISIELLNQLNLGKYKKHLDENDVVQFISHPKMLTKHGLNVFRKYLKYAHEKYNLDFDFKSLI